MPKFLIEREVPGIGQLSTEEWIGRAALSNRVVAEIGPTIQWIESYVTDNKMYCLYIAPDEATIRRHAEVGGFPANSIRQVRTVIDPSSAEG